MEEQKFRKLTINLPKDKIYNHRPWFIAGLIFAASMLIFIACLYYKFSVTKPH